MANYELVGLDTATPQLRGIPSGSVGVVPGGLSVAEGIVYTQTGTGAVASTVEAKLDNFATFEDFGAVGDGVTDDTTAITNALDSGLPLMARSGATYLITTIDFEGSVYIKTTGAEPATIYCATTPGNAMIRFKGTAKSATTLSANVAAGASSFTVTSAANIAVGDLLRIQSTTLWPCDNRGTVYYGQLCKVIAVAGTTVTIEDTILFGYESGDSVTPATPISAYLDNIEFSRLAFDGVSVGPQLMYAKEAVLENCKYINGTTAGLSLIYSYKCRVNFGSASGSNYASAGTSGYGVVINGSYGCQVAGLYTYNCRRGVDVNGTVIPSIHNTITDCQFTSGGYAEDGVAMWPIGTLQSDGCGSHGGSYASVFRNNRCINPRNGVILRGWNDIAENNVIVGKVEYPIVLQYTRGPVVIGNKYLDQVETSYLSSINGNYAFRPDYMVYVNVNNILDDEETRIERNYCKRAKVGFMYLDGNSGTETENMVLNDNYCEVINASTTTAYFMLGSSTKYLPGAYLTNNKMVCPDAYTQSFSSNVGLWGISASNVSQIAENAWRVYITDDTAVKIQTNIGVNSSQAMVRMYQTATSTSNRLNSLIRNASTATVDLGGTSGVTIAATALTGTTGVDGTVTVSLFDKAFYVENRIGSTLQFNVFIDG